MRFFSQILSNQALSKKNNKRALLLHNKKSMLICKGNSICSSMPDQLIIQSAAISLRMTMTASSNNLLLGQVVGFRRNQMPPDHLTMSLVSTVDMNSPDHTSSTRIPSWNSSTSLDSSQTCAATSSGQDMRARTSSSSLREVPSLPWTLRPISKPDSSSVTQLLFAASISTRKET